MDSRKKILDAAITLFAQKGMHGTRMEDIGKAAEINKAMVYYYFSDKESLFQEALNMIVKQIYSRIAKGIGQARKQNYPPKEMLVQFVRLQFREYSHDKNWTQLIMNILSYDAQKLQIAFRNAFIEQQLKEHELIEQSFKEGVSQGIFRDIDFIQVFISIIGMNLIYFLAKPIAETLLDLNITNENEFLKSREESIIDLLLRGILVSDQGSD